MARGRRLIGLFWGGLWRRSDGFSLVEVVSSLGIISFGLVALLGLLPIGLRASRDAREITAETLICQYLSNLARQTPPVQWPSILEPRAYYFDRQGLEVSANSPEVFYRAALVRGGSSGAAISSDGAYVSSNLATMRMILKKLQGSGAERMRALHLVAVGR